MKKRLLITTENLNMGGVETSLITLLNKIDYKKWEVDLVTLDKGLLDKEVPKDVNHKILDINYKGIIPRILKSIKTKSLIKKYKNDKEYALAIAYYGLNNYSDMYAAASNAKKKYVWVHNDFKSALESSKYPALIKLRNKFMKSKFTYFDKIVSVSENCKINFESLFGFKEKSISIYNLLNGEKYIENSKIKTDIKMDDKCFNICSIGRLVKSKQVDKLLSTIKELKDKNLKVKAYIIGDGPEKENLEKYVEENNLNDNVIFTGVLTNPYNILKQADLFVSLSKHESLGLVLLEALILDIPVLSYSNDGAKDICENIAPKDKCVLVDNDNALYILEKIITKKIKFSNEKFDYKKYNDLIKESYKKELELDLE